MHWALTSIKRGNRAGMQAGLVLTVALGSTFLLTQVIEYHRLGFNTADTSFASTFFGLTGLHGGHVLVGLTILCICIWANTIGALVPLLARRCGIDPAVISAPFITTLVDATGLVIYFSIAILLLVKLSR